MTSPTSLSRAELAAKIAANLDTVQRTIAQCSPNASAVTVVAVTKTQPLEVVLAAYDAGLTHFAENYVDELTGKVSAASVPDELTWQFIGAVQSRKIAVIARHADVVASISRQKEIERLADCDVPLPRIMIQVDFTSALGRNGASARDVPSLVDLARRHSIVVDGLMTVASPVRDEASVAFRELAAIAAGEGLSELSMGMSGDYDLALAAGATQIRLGQTIFGPRNPPTDVS